MPTPFKPLTASRSQLVALGLALLGCSAAAPIASPSPALRPATRSALGSEREGAPGKGGPGVTADCRAWSTHVDGPYRYENNQWGGDKLKQGKGEQCLLTRTVGGRVETGWTWHWPGLDPSVFAYPEIEFGWKPWTGGKSTDPRFPMRVSDVPLVSIHYEVETEADGSYDLAPEVWLTSEAPKSGAANPKSITTEVMFWMDYAEKARPAGEVVETPTLDGVTYELWKADQIGVSSNGKGWTLLSFKSPTIQRKGTISVDTLLKHLVRSKLVNPDHYLAGVEFGNEVMGGSGTTWVKRFDVEVGAAR